MDRQINFRPELADGRRVVQGEPAAAGSLRPVWHSGWAARRRQPPEQMSSMLARNPKTEPPNLRVAHSGLRVLAAVTHSGRPLSHLVDTHRQLGHPTVQPVQPTNSPVHTSIQPSGREMGSRLYTFCTSCIQTVQLQVLSGQKVAVDVRPGWSEIDGCLTGSTVARNGSRQHVS